MLSSLHDNNFVPQFRILFCVVLFEYTLFIFSGVSLSFLSGDSFYSFGADPASWLVYVSEIPQFIIGHHWAGLLLDSLIIVLLLLFIRDPFNNRIALALLILLFVFYITLMGYLTHRNYQVGFFLVFIPFIFSKNTSRFFAYEAVRYFMLVFYFSAACLKLSANSLHDPAHFSHMLSTQFTAYFLEGNNGWRADLNIYLISHIKLSYTLYLCSFVLEFFAFIGFITKRFDKWLAALFLTFHFMTWLIMDIAPFGEIAFISLLFLSRSFSKNLDPDNIRVH